MARNALSPFSSGALSPFLMLHREMDRLFENVVRAAAGPSEASTAAEIMVPEINVSETEKELRITAELPGVTEKDIEVRLDDDVLTIRGQKTFERKDDKENYHLVERSFGTFQRSLRLPFRINPEEVQARFENGVLTLTLPKPQGEERSRRITVQGGASQSGQADPGSQADHKDAGQSLENQPS